MPKDVTAPSKSSPDTPLDRPRQVGNIGRAAWAPERDLDYPEWVATGRMLGGIGRGAQWWVGDWLVYGAGKWGEKYVDAAKVTGYDTGSLRNMASLAARFELSRRRDKLTWGHHAAVASLSVCEQDRWLDRAVSLRLSVADLRLEVRAITGTGTTSDLDEPEVPAGALDGSGCNERGSHANEQRGASDAASSVAARICPQCGQRVPTPR